MKNLLRIMISGSLLILCTISLHAQEPKEKLTAAERASKITEKMKKALNLTDEQTKKVLAVNQDFTTKMEKQRELNKEDRKNSRDEMKKIDDDQDARMKEILTADQYKSYLDLKERRKNNERQGKGERPDRPERPDGPEPK